MYPTVFAGVALLGLTTALLADSVDRRAQGAYEQCEQPFRSAIDPKANVSVGGGQGWTGGTTCASGWTCVYQSEWYSQCLQSTAGTSTTTIKTVATTTSPAHVPTVYLCGDSTMAKNGGGSGTEGWGQYLQYSFSNAAAVISNQAIAGRSARSFTREGRFDTVVGLVKAGDWVVIEFGHNDGGSLSPTDNGRTDCFGNGAQTSQTTYKYIFLTLLMFSSYPLYPD
jgi:hypothetical protein